MSHRHLETQGCASCDELLLAGFSAGDPRLARRFVRRFQASVYGVAYAIVQDSVLAEDIARQTFDRARLQAGANDPRRGSMRGWLVRTTRDLAIDAVRVQRPAPLDVRQLDALLGLMMHPPEQEVLNAEESDMRSASVRGALAALPREQARAVILAVIHGLRAQQMPTTRTCRWEPRNIGSGPDWSNSTGHDRQRAISAHDKTCAPARTSTPGRCPRARGTTPT